MQNILGNSIIGFFLTISLFMAYFPVGVRALEESGTATSTETLRGDTQEGETVTTIEQKIPLEAPSPSIQLTYDNSEIPIILPRSSWENSEGLQKLLAWLPEDEHMPPDYYPIERIVVHDLGCSLASPTCNSDIVDPKALIQNIYRFHSVTRGWGDIGYNYIIDRQGRIYEGRYGGNGARAAHVYDDRQCINFNVGSVGILLLGNYTQSSMPDAMQQSLERLTAWIAAANNLELSNTRTTTVWQNPKLDRYCNVLTGGFTTSFTGRVLLSHGDIEAGNSDKFDLSLINQQAATLKETLSRYVYEAQGGTGRYTIENGVKIPYASEIATNLTQSENTALPSNTESGVASTATSTETISSETPPVTAQTPRLIAINKNQLDLFPVSQKSVFNDGMIVKSETRPLSFLIEKGKRKNIVSQTILTARGLNSSNAVAVTDRELGRYPIEGLLGYPEGSLLGEKTTGNVYVIKDNKRRHITSAALFNALKFVWSNIRTALTDELKVQSLGDPLIFPDGTLFKGSSPRVWVLEDAKRRPIASAGLFEKRGFKWSAIRTLEDFEIERYPLGTFLSWPDGTLIRGENKPEVYLVKDSGQKEWIQTAEEFESRGYGWQNIISVSSEELTDYPVLGVNPLTLAKEEPSPAALPADQNPVEEVTPPAEHPISQESTSTPSQLSQGPNIRIAIFALTAGKQFIMGSSGGTFRVLHNGNLILETKDAKEEFVTNYNELSQTGIVRFEPIGEKPAPSGVEGTILKIVSYEDRPSWNPSLNDNLFRGVIEIAYSQKSQKFWVVNELPMEQYLKGVAEILNGDPLEYRKAFIVAARSYALYHLNRGGKREGEPYHLNNTPNDQLYKGYGFEARAYDPVEAVNLTAGEAATFNGNIIVGAYSSGAPGPTISACALWGGQFCDAQFDYLDGGVADPEGTIYGYQSCGGANHCTGIDAAGARKMAELGKTYQEILQWYYPGIAVEKKW